MTHDKFDKHRRSAPTQRPGSLTVEIHVKGNAQFGALSEEARLMAADVLKFLADREDNASPREHIEALLFAAGMLLRTDEIPPARLQVSMREDGPYTVVIDAVKKRRDD